MCVARFDSETKATFLDLYTKVDAEAEAYEEVEEEDYDQGFDKPNYSQGEDYVDPSNDEDLF